jgi:hypothetical protein
VKSAVYDPLYPEPGKHNAACPDEKHGDKAKKVKRAAEVAAQEQKRQKVEKASEKLVKPVLASAESALMVNHRDLGHVPALPVGKHRQVAVLFAVDFEVFRGFRAVRLETAVEVVKFHTGKD